MQTWEYPRFERLYHSSVTWEIENTSHGFSALSDKVESGEFLVDLDEPIKLKLALAFCHDDGKQPALEGTLQLLLSKSGVRNIHIKVRITVANNNKVFYSDNRDTVLSRETEINFGTFDVYQYVFNNFEEKYKVSKFTIICDFRRDFPKMCYPNEDLRVLSDDLRNIFETGNALKDLHLKVDNAIIAAHASIIKARSPYICSILQQFPELNVIDLTGKVSSTQLMGLIMYWYTGNLGFLPRLPCPSTFHLMINMGDLRLRSYIDPQAIKLHTSYDIRTETDEWVIKDITFIEKLQNLENLAYFSYTYENGSSKLYFVYIKDYISLTIKNTGVKHAEHAVYLEVFLEDESRNEYGLKGTISWLNILDEYKFPEFMKCLDFIKIRRDLLKDGLRIGCRIFSGTGSVKRVFVEQSIAEKSKVPKPNSYNILADDMKKLFEYECTGDISLKVGSRKFPVHKAVLAARSGYFNSISNEPDFSKTKEIEIDDIEPDDLLKILKYMYYAETIEMNEELASRLYLASRKYEISRLDDLCSLYLPSLQTVGNIDNDEPAESLEYSVSKNSALPFIQTKSDNVLKEENLGSFQNGTIELSSKIKSEVDGNNPEVSNGNLA